MSLYWRFFSMVNLQCCIIRKNYFFILYIWIVLIVRSHRVKANSARPMVDWLGTFSSFGCPHSRGYCVFSVCFMRWSAWSRNFFHNSIWLFHSSLMVLMYFLIFKCQLTNCSWIRFDISRNLCWIISNETHSKVLYVFIFIHIFSRSSMKWIFAVIFLMKNQKK